MSEESKGGISCEGLDQAFDAEETRKSNLLFEAQVLRARQQTEEAAARLAEAAAIEEHLAEICEQKGLLRKSWVHRFGAVCAWAQAGNIHTAISSGEKILARPDLPERLRHHIDDYVQDLRRRRAQWSKELAVTATAG
jgi:hypothetical protein